MRRDAEGNVTGYQTVFRDVTELSRARDELLASREQLRRLAVRIQEAREDERSYLARELHDHFSQELTALRLDLDSLRRGLPPSADAALKRIDDITAMVDGMSQEMRQVISEMRPGMLDDLGLCAAIDWQAGQFTERTGIKCNLSLTADDRDISPAFGTALFRVLQELLNNVAQHSGAASAEISLTATEDTICLTVSDDGKGITDAELNSPSSLGLLGMQRAPSRVRRHPGNRRSTGRGRHSGRVSAQASPDRCVADPTRNWLTRQPAATTADAPRGPGARLTTTLLHHPTRRVRVATISTISPRQASLH